MRFTHLGDAGLNEQAINVDMKLSKKKRQHVLGRVCQWGGNIREK